VLVRTETTIAASHYIRGHEGHCARSHGHNWKIVVWIEDPVLDELGRVWDFGNLKKITRRLDHSGRLVNDIIHRNGTAENMAEWIAEEIIKTYKLPEMLRVRVWETEKNYAEVTKGVGR